MRRRFTRPVNSDRSRLAGTPLRLFTRAETALGQDEKGINRAGGRYIAWFRDPAGTSWPYSSSAVSQRHCAEPPTRVHSCCLPRGRLAIGTLSIVFLPAEVPNVADSYAGVSGLVERSAAAYAASVPEDPADRPIRLAPVLPQLRLDREVLALLLHRLDREVLALLPHRPAPEDLVFRLRLLVREAPVGRDFLQVRRALSHLANLKVLAVQPVPQAL